MTVIENLKSIFLSLIGLGVLISCGTEPTPTYQLTTSVVGNGSVSPSSGQFDEGESVTIISTPDSGWIFSNWEGDWTSSQTPAIITMDRDKTIIGVFERKEYPLNITIKGEGSVSERIVSQPKVTDYPFETVVELTPLPDKEWWVFSSWSGDITSDQQVVVVTVNGETNVTLNLGFTGTSSKTTYEYDANNNLIERISYYSDGTECCRHTYVFDTNNNMIEHNAYGSNGFVYSKKYEYDSNNNMTKESRLELDGTVSYWIDNIYDSNNNVVERLYHDSSGLVIRVTLEYDSNSNLIKRTNTRVDGSQNDWVEYQYDSNNNLIEQSYYSSNYNGLYLRDTFTYNSNNDITEWIKLYSINNQTSYRFIYEYDEYFNRIKETVYYYDTGEIAGWIEYQYDSNNNRITFINYFPDGSQNYKMTYEYDSENRKVKESSFNDSNSPTYFITFEYDSNSNLTVEVRNEYQKGKVVSNQKETDPIQELCNQLNLPEQHLIPILCEE